MLLQIFYFYLLKKIYLGNLCTQHGAWTCNPKIKSPVPFWLNQAGAPTMEYECEYEYESIFKYESFIFIVCEAA